jgi:glycogen operon protein
MPSHSRQEKNLMSIVRSDFEFTRGHPLPLGATLMRGGINFSVFSRHATQVTLVIFLPGDPDPVLELPLDSRYNRTGDIWHAFVFGLDPGIEYGYRLDRLPNPEPEIHRYDRKKILVDPYARALSGGAHWGDTLHLQTSVSSTGTVRTRHSKVVDNDAFDWGVDQPLNLHLADTIIYEMHVRGFTRHPSSGVSRPGTFQGVVEKIPYLRDLGITAVELMPITEFEENDNPRTNPLTGETLRNFWGYHPISFFAPKASYASQPDNDGMVREFKEMVKALHEAGMEVILDMVFNHTAEGNNRGPTFSFRGIDNAIYYILEGAAGEYANFSGCGNTLNCNHPVVRSLIMDCLHYWVTEMHVDGFRFDLASILGRGRDGSVLANPPLLEKIAGDPVLANTKVIAEAWDAAGLYQVGSFPHWGRWAEWNGKFRDDVRRFVKGESGMVPILATRLTGSPDLYQGSGRAPYHSINFVTSHDGFTLHDLVSYDHKHNQANGEENRDGLNENLSWNCGEEGPSQSPEVLALRRRQMKNFAAILLLAQGVPMILAGDELCQTQQGNNNAYCQDNEISWLHWNGLKASPDLFRFFKLMIDFRKQHSRLRGRQFVENGNAGLPRVSWHGVKLDQPDWGWESHSLAMRWHGDHKAWDIYVIFNAYWEKLTFELPPLAGGRRWRRFVDTSLEPPQEIAEAGQEPLLANQHAYGANPRSVVVLAGN